jgi:hypothetical protein
MAYRAQNPVGLLFYRGSSSGSFAIFTAIRRASSLVSNLAADRRPGSSERLSALIADEKASVQFLDGPRWREASSDFNRKLVYPKLVF